MKPTIRTLALLAFVLSTIPAAHAQDPYAFALSGALVDVSSTAVDEEGNLYVAGNLRGTTDFDPGPGAFELAGSNGGQDLFVASYNSAGELRYALALKNTPALFHEEAFTGGIDVDNAGNVYITGVFNGTTDFDPGPGEFELTSVLRDGFVASYDSGGALRYAFRLGGPDISFYSIEMLGLSVDDVGNAYVVGAFGETIDFDPGPGEFELSGEGPINGFVASYDSEGELRYAFSLVSSESVFTNGVAIDDAGNVYVTGSFSGTVDFDPGPGAFELSGVLGNGFVASYDSGGALRYAFALTSDENYLFFSTRGIAADGAGNIYVVGFFEGTADFDPGPGAFEIGASNRIGTFVASYDGTGALRYAFELSVSDTIVLGGGVAADVAVDGAGNAYIVGFLPGTVDFDPGPDEVELSVDGPWDGFVASYDGDGSFRSAFALGGISASALGFSVAVDGAGNAYVAGLFSGTADFDPGPGEFELTAREPQDVFVTSYDSAGNLRASVGSEAPEITEVAIPPEPIAVGEEVGMKATFTDPDLGDVHTCTVDFGDGTSTEGTVDEARGVCTAATAYAEAGIYTVAVTITDAEGASDTEAAEAYVVVYDPSAGFVTGGGWIDSPAGAYAPDPALTGKASFWFVAKYKRGRSVPDGSTEFQFRAGDLNVHSTAYEWLVVAGERAKFKGTATVNGVGDYGFMLTATDADPDLFRIKVWDRTDGDVVVYDNQMGTDDDGYTGTALGGGRVVIHSKAESREAASESAARAGSPDAFALHPPWPNPASGAMRVAFDVPETVHVRVRVIDVVGREVAVLTDGEVGPGTYKVRWNGRAARSLAAGVYLVRLEAGSFMATQRVTLLP